MAYTPIVPYKRLDGNPGQFPMMRYPENAGSSAKRGVPVAMTAGMVDESATIDGVTKTIIGFSSEFFHNLTTDNTPKPLTYGSVDNQSAAVLIPGGAPLSDGKIGVFIAKDEVMFRGKLKSDQSVALTDLPRLAGLTKDGTTGQWFVDITDATPTAAEGACVLIQEVIDPAGTLGGEVGFVVSRGFQQLTP